MKERISNLPAENPTPNSLFFTGSITKQMLSAIILKYVELEILDLYAPIEKYLTDQWDVLEVKTITLENLLTNTSGLVLAVMVYAGAHVSGGHYNPAVSLALFFRNKLNIQGLIGYVILQLLGAVAAAFVVMYLKHDFTSAALQLDPWKALLAEFLFTFALCYVVINVATGKKNRGNSLIISKNRH